MQSTCRDAAYGIFLALAIGVPLAGSVIVATMGEAGMMVGILVMLIAMVGTALGLVLALVCWREWPLLVLAALAAASAKAWAEGLLGWYVLPPIFFALAAIGFSAWWFRGRRSAPPG